MTKKSDNSGPPFTVERYGSLGESIIAERDWLQVELTQLRGNLTLAEEGLASAMQEIEGLKFVVATSATARRSLDAEIERLTQKTASEPSEQPACAYIGAPQGEPQPCVLPAGHPPPHAHAAKSPAEPVRLSASEAASFGKTLARSPRRVEPGTLPPLPSVYGTFTARDPNDVTQELWTRTGYWIEQRPAVKSDSTDE